MSVINMGSFAGPAELRDGVAVTFVRMRLTFELGGFTVRPAGQADEPSEFLPLLNADSDFVDASTLRTGKQAFDDDDAAMFLWQSEMMENSHLLAVRNAQGRLVAAITLLLPHPVEQQPWLGALLLGADTDLDTTASPVIGALEAELTDAQWGALFVSPMTSEQERISWWCSAGYDPVGVRTDNDKREVLVLRKDL